MAERCITVAGSLFEFLGFPASSGAVGTQSLTRVPIRRTPPRRVDPAASTLSLAGLTEPDGTDHGVQDRVIN